eukprot:CAMPEP_0172214248 /NCGR_PEP_ID=MMETSP1050-20130122/38053_1 /TAXON_ID=233186 /ORGANISM="Cryptomonas curvata, Strain CCAP979/52" /LENGTH=241 /DNA_ID=CAMNT_0012895191 /DNA_START=2158 /DNA_END=2880 /DNA_ORIENTATION=-
MSNNWGLFARAVPTFEEQDKQIEAKSVANGIHMFSLPIFWPFVSKLDGLRRLSESVKTEVTGPLKSPTERVHWFLSTVTQFQHYSPCASNQGIKVVECSVLLNPACPARCAPEFKPDKFLGILNGEPVEVLAIHDIGIPEPCTDLVYLLIDDLIHKASEKLDRYHRVWCSSGEAMLVSSTTTRSFNAAGKLVEIQLQIRAISADEYDAAVRRAPSSCPLFAMGDRRSGRELLEQASAEALW